MKILHLGMCATGLQNPNGLQIAFMNHGEYQELNCGHPNFNDEARRLSNSFRPDLIFMQIQTPNIIHSDTVRHFRNNGAFVINFTGDVRTPLPEWYFHTESNLTLFNNTNDIQEAKSRGLCADFLFLGYNENIYKPEGESHSMPEIVFFGNNYGDGYFPLSKMRIDMVEMLRNKYGNRFGLYGNGWRNVNGDFNSSQHEEAKAYRGAKIAINLSHFAYGRYSSDRMLRLMGTGVPICLTHNFPELETDFLDGYNVRVWQNFEDLCNQIDYYSVNDDERKKIAENGMIACQKMFTFEKMIDELIILYKKYK